MKRTLALALALLGGGCTLNLSSVGAWRLAAAAPVVLSSPQLVALPAGRILALNSFDQRTGEPVPHPYLYDSSRDRWSEQAQVPEPRLGGIAIGLGGDRVLVAGGTAGSSTDFGQLRSAWLYDARADSWDRLPDLPALQPDAAAVRLTSGRILVAGGVRLQGNAPVGYLGDTAVFDPPSRRWTVLPPLPGPRPRFVLAALPGGRALAVGGCKPFPNTGQRPTSAPAGLSEVDEFTGSGWRRSAALPQAACPSAAYPLSAGRVLVAVQGAAPLLYDSGRWTVLPAPPVPPAPIPDAAVGLPGDRLLQLVSVQQGNTVLLGGEVLDVSSRTWTAATTVSFPGADVGLGSTAAPTGGGDVVVLASTITARFRVDASPPAANSLDSPGWTLVLAGLVLALGLAAALLRLRRV